MVRESEQRRVEQYCFSILNPGLITHILQQHNLTYSVFKHPLIMATSLPSGVVQSFEEEMNGMLDGKSIKRERLVLDHVGATGIINYALFADSRQGVAEQLKEISGFYRAWVA